MEREAIRRLVRRARARLEAARIVRGAARGALLLGALALAAELLGKAWAPLRGPAALPWALLALGAAVGAAWTAARGRVSLADAALLLDRRLGTGERIATVLTRGRDEFTDRVAAELAPVARLPRIPLPREAGFLPAALFLLFAAGLLPAAGAAAAAPGGPRPAEVASGAGAAAPADAPPPDVAAALERLASGHAPAAEEAEALQEAIRRGVHTPEERARARDALERAAEGDAGAAREVAEALAGLRGGRTPGTPAESSPSVPGTVRGGLPAVAYPEEEEFLLAYRRALHQEKGQ